MFKLQLQPQLIILLALAIIFYVTKNMALSYIAALMAVLVFIHNYRTEKFEDFEEDNLESVQNNQVPYLRKTEKELNKLKEYVPYTISPYLEVPYMNKNIKGNDPMGVNQLNIEKIYPKTDMNPFVNNVAYPEACLEGNAMFSTDRGCIKLRPDQIQQLSHRGYNMDPKRSYI